MKAPDAPIVPMNMECASTIFENKFSKIVEAFVIFVRFTDYTGDYAAKAV